jgi:hypothetical protein
LSIHRYQKTHDSVRNDVLYNTLREFRVCMKLVGLIKMCINETYSKIHIGKYLDHPCGLVLRVLGYRFRGPKFDSQRYQIF